MIESERCDDGYPCTNLTLGVMIKLFPVGGPAPQEEVDAGAVGNLAGLARTLEFNEKADLLFFSIDPRLVPDQTGPLYSECLAATGAYVKEKKMRLMTCPDGPCSTRRTADLVRLDAHRSGRDSEGTNLDRRNERFSRRIRRPP